MRGSPGAFRRQQDGEACAASGAGLILKIAAQVAQEAPGNAKAEAAAGMPGGQGIVNPVERLKQQGFVPARNAWPPV